MEPWETLLKNIDTTLPADGKTAPPQEFIPKEIIRKRVKKTAEPKVILQKITSEIWVYTDIEGKTVATGAAQDITVFPEMAKSEAIKLINQSKKKKENPEA